MKKAYYFRLSYYLILFLTMSSCGYHYGQGGTLSRYTTISVPFANGDKNGDLTASVIREIQNSGVLNYAQSGGELILDIKVIEISDENIGFRYDRNKRGKETKSVIPVETRLKLVVDLSVKESASCMVLLGPIRLFTWIDYDHDYFSSPNGVNIFSLGQLTDVEAATDAAQQPLNIKMAKKIVDYITGYW